MLNLSKNANEEFGGPSEEHFPLENLVTFHAPGYFGAADVSQPKANETKMLVVMPLLANPSIHLFLHMWNL